MDLQTCLKTSLRIKLQDFLHPPLCDSLLLPRLWYRDVNSFSNEHDFRHVDKSDVHIWPTFTPVELCDLLSCDGCKHSKKQRIVVTVGVGGVGKTTSVQLSALGWATDQDLHNIYLLFPLNFWELNLIETKLSFMKLLRMFYPHLKKRLNASSLHQNNVWFVLDGLEDFKFPLNFSCQSVTDVSEDCTVDVLVANLIRGDLLPSAHVWITTHSSAATQIPVDFLLKQTELLGFNDRQKEQNFRNIIKHEQLVIKAIDHVKVSRSLDFLSEIPPVCTIMASVLKKHLNLNPVYKIKPLSLTQIYTKLIEEAGNQDILSKLKKLAAIQWEKGNVMFKDDLLEAGITKEEASDFSKQCPLVLKEETGLNNISVFKFGHFSLKEFFAASAKLDDMLESKDSSLSEMIQRLVDETLENIRGKLDLILRFIFGLIKERHLLDPSDKLFGYTKTTILESIVFPGNPWLLHALREYDSQAFLVEVRTYLKHGVMLGPCQEQLDWDFLCERMRTFEGMKDVFELQVSMRCDENLLRHLPSIMKTRKVSLRFSNLTERCCPALASVLESDESYMRVLELGYNSLGDAGVSLLSAGLCSPGCRLKSLRLQGCGLTSRGCDDVASVLLRSLTLVELDLSRNNLGDEGIWKLSEGLSGTPCKLEVLRLSQCNIEHRGCEYLAKALDQNHNSLRILDLSINRIRDDGANNLCDNFDIWRVLKLELYHCGLTSRCCRNIGDALRNPCNRLSYLNLSNNKLKDEGLKGICERFSSYCGLEKLNLSRCGITSDGCVTLAKLLDEPLEVYEGSQGQPGFRRVQVQDLDLSKNCIGDKGVHILLAVLKNPYSGMRTLNLRRCSLTERSCADLAPGLGLGLTHVWDLDLSGNELKDQGVKNLCVGLRSSKCPVRTLMLRSCGLTSKGVDFLSSALKSNQHLTELHLMGNKVDESDMSSLMELIHNPTHTLQTIDFPAD